MRQSVLLFLLFFSGALLYVLSQSANSNRAALLLLYTQGDSLYRKALNLSLQPVYDEAEEERLNQEALAKFSLLLQTAADKHLPADTTQFFAAVKAGELQHYFDSFAPALQCYNTAIRLKATLPVLSDSFLFKPFLFAGLIQYNQNNLDSALVFLKKAESLQAKTPQRLQESERLYNILGSIYYEYGNYRQAKNYFLKAAEMLSPSNPAYGELLVNYKINLATALFKSEAYDSANTIYHSLLNKTKFLLNPIHNNLGLIQLAVGAPRQALAYFRKVSYNNHLQIGLYNDMANAYFQLKQYDSAKHFLQKALDLNRQFNPANTSTDHGRTLKLLGDLETAVGQQLSALRFYQQAIHQFYPFYRDTATQANPTKFSGAFSYINLFHTLVAKADALHQLSLQASEQSWLSEELKAYQAAFGLIAYVEQTYESDEARLFLTKIKYQVHNKPIEAAYRLYQLTGDQQYVEALYRLDQQNKATTLALSRQLNTELTAVNPPLLEKELRIRSAISRLSLKASNITDSTALAALNQTIRDLEIRLGKVQDSVNEQASVRETKIPSLSTLQASVLQAKTAVVSYHLSDKELITLFLTKTSVHCFQQDLPQNFSEQINSYIDAVRNPTSRMNAPEEKELYQILLGRLPLESITQLVIIPDDMLAYLPFESLQRADGRYVVEDLAIQYQYSTALLKKTKSHLAHAAVLAFAPFTERSSGDSLPALPFSGKEVQDLNGKKFLSEAATKTAFLQNAGSLPVLHLATHAAVNEKAENLSYIAFSPVEKDHLLYAQEIYHLPLQKTDLVILSACETGSGQLIRGEGVMSLSRAFRYAGCANIMTTLWKANDFSTAWLTTRIHQYLQKKVHAAVAVQKAKNDYLNDKSIHPRLKSPFFWSHLVFIGDVQEEESFWQEWWIAGAAMVSGILFFLFRRRSGKLRTEHV